MFGPSSSFLPKVSPDACETDNTVERCSHNILPAQKGPSYFMGEQQQAQDTISRCKVAAASRVTFVAPDSSPESIYCLVLSTFCPQEKKVKQVGTCCCWLTRQYLIKNGELGFQFQMSRTSWSLSYGILSGLMFEDSQMTINAMQISLQVTRLSSVDVGQT
jgi:hypothetical protein